MLLFEISYFSEFGGFFWNLLFFGVCCVWKYGVEICCFLKFVVLWNLLFLETWYYWSMLFFHLFLKSIFWNLLCLEICFFYICCFLESVVLESCSFNFAVFLNLLFLKSVLWNLLFLEICCFLNLLFIQSVVYLICCIFLIAKMSKNIFV